MTPQPRRAKTVRTKPKPYSRPLPSDFQLSWKSTTTHRQNTTPSAPTISHAELAEPRYVRSITRNGAELSVGCSRAIPDAHPPMG